MKAILIVEYDDEFDIDDLMVDYTLFHNEKKVFKMFNEILIPMPQKENEFEKGLNEYDRGWRIGYNFCIDEILGVEE